jgi:hypothetical protein
MKPRAMLVLASLLLAACSGLSPVPIQSGDKCFRCRRPISDLRIAAEIVDQDGRAFKFRTSGCMAKFLKEHPQEGARVFVVDYPTGRLVKAEGAIFIPTMMGEGPERALDYSAYALTESAREAAAREKTTPVSWDDVLAAAKP